MQLSNISRQPSASKTIFSGFQNATINLDNKTVTFIGKESKKFNLVRGDDGSSRLRGNGSTKHLPDNFMPRDAALSEDCGEFGDTYSVKVLGDEDALPSIKQVLDGLQEDYHAMIRDLS